jgi:hypothetical protein
VLRPKNAQNSTKNGINQLLQKKFSNFSMDQFSSFYWKNNFFPSKTSSDRFKLTYETKKKKFDVKAQTTVEGRGEVAYSGSFWVTQKGLIGWNFGNDSIQFIYPTC